MNPNYSQIKFHYLEPPHNHIPPCDQPNCQAPANWTIKFIKVTAQDQPDHALKSSFCWPHAINWCARNLRVDLNAAPRMP